LRKRVLIVEDDETRCDWFRRRLAACDLDVTCDVGRAFELLAANVYDLILLDHDLREEHYFSDSADDERTGYAVAAWLAARPGPRRRSSSTRSTTPARSGCSKPSRARASTPSASRSPTCKAGCGFKEGVRAEAVQAAVAPRVQFECDRYPVPRQIGDSTDLATVNARRFSFDSACTRPEARWP
jgi:CheY-like chemotaxis protein